MPQLPRGDFPRYYPWKRCAGALRGFPAQCGKEDRLKEEVMAAIRVQSTNAPVAQPPLPFPEEPEVEPQTLFAREAARFEEARIAEEVEEASEGEVVLEGETFVEEPAAEEGLATLPAAPLRLRGEVGESLSELQMLCEYAAESGLYPGQTFIGLLTKALISKALGISAAAGFSSIHVIRNQPSLSAELQRALAIRAGYRFKCLHSDRKRCDLELVEAATGEVIGSASFTAEEAEQAGLLKGEAWSRWRNEMLWARCSTRLISRFCPHILFGIEAKQP